MSHGSQLRPEWVPALFASARANRGTLALCAVFAAFAIDLGNFTIGGDGTRYYSFVQRLFDDTSRATAYNFGVGLMNAPFYGAARILSSAIAVPGIQSPTAASIAIASIFWILVSAAIAAWLMARLNIGFPAFAIGAAIFGSPLWFYGSFLPSYSHAADAAAFSLTAGALYELLQTPSLGWCAAAGAGFALMCATRSANAGALVAVLVALVAFRRIRDALLIGGSAIITGAILVSIPLSLGLSLTKNQRGGDIASATLGLSPLSPVRMLFTLHRGLFLWTPVTALAVVGIAVGIRRGANRQYLVVLSAAVLGLLLSYLDVKTWDAAGSFSNRFLASPLVFYAIGIGCLLEALTGNVRRLATIGVVLCTLFSLFVGMNQAYGARQQDGVDNILGNYFTGKRTLRDFAHLTWERSHLRQVVDHLGA